MCLKVWLARLGDSQVAMKILRRALLEVDESVKEEFEKEIEFMQRTRHPNLVRFIGAGQLEDDTQTPFLVLELASASLSGILWGSAQRSLTWVQRVSIATDVARGMAHIHSLGHIHRDLKSGNVLMTTSLQAKVADFGSIRRLLLNANNMDRRRVPRTALSSPSSNSATLTTGVGTPLYMSIEALGGQPYNSATDVWSYGVLLWELATAERPDLLEQEGSQGGAPMIVMHNLLLSGKRLRIDPTWPTALRQLVGQSWLSNSAARPTFDTILKRFLPSLAAAAGLLDVEV